MPRTSLSDVVSTHLIPLVRVRGGDDSERGILERMRHHGVPGVQLTTIEDGEITWTGTYGELELASGRHVDERSLFQAASISKPVTALAVLRLVAEGTLNLDQPVNGYLRSWQLPENDHTRLRPVTLRALLSHTAGTTVHGFPGYAVGAPLPTIQEILDGEPPANTKPVRVELPVGEQFRYSGGGTMIVQQLLAEVTGQNFADLMRILVLEPLGMADSTFEQPLPQHLHSRAATAHDESGVVPGQWHVYPEMAAAGLWTTASDLARYVRGVQGALAGLTDSLIPPALAREMVASQNGVPVGLGPQLMGMEGDRRFIHSGGNRGFQCRFVGFVDHTDGIVVMTNGPFTAALLLNEIIGAVGAASGWVDFPLVEVVPIAQSDDLDRFVGDYELRGVIVTVGLHNDRLVMTTPFGQTVEMWRVSDREFVLPDTTRVTFEITGQRAARATLKQWGDVYVATRAEVGLQA